MSQNELQRVVVVVKGDGFNSDGGGFASLIINGKKYSAETVVAAIESAQAVAPDTSDAAVADQLVKDWDSQGRMPQMAWDFRGFAQDAMRRSRQAVAPGGYRKIGTITGTYSPGYSMALLPIADAPIGTDLYAAAPVVAPGGGEVLRSLEFLLAGNDRHYLTVTTELVREVVTALRSGEGLRDRLIRCRPSVKHMAKLAARSVDKLGVGALPAHYAPALESEEKEWDEMLDFIDMLAAAPASEAVDNDARIARALEYLHPHLDLGDSRFPADWAVELAAILTGGKPAASSAAGECRCHEGNGARDCAIHTQADFDAQDHRAEQEQAGELFQQVGEFLDGLGWQARNDAQWHNLRDNLPQLAALLRRAARVEVDEARLSRAYSAWSNAKMADPTNTRERLRIAITAALEPQK